MNRAMNLAELSTATQKHGAVIVIGGSVMGVGVNVNKNDPNYAGENTVKFSVHAEEAALRACKGANLRRATIYVARVNKKGEPAMSKPCLRCQKAIKDAGIRKVVYTIDSSMEL